MAGVKLLKPEPFFSEERPSLALFSLPEWLPLDEQAPTPLRLRGLPVRVAL